MPTATKTPAAEPQRDSAGPQPAGGERRSLERRGPVTFTPRFQLDPGRVRTRSLDAAAMRPTSDPAEIAEQGFVGAAQDVPYRREMEGLFHRDLGGVRTFSGPAAARANHALRSHAYTVGHRIGFATPSPPRALVAHELTHVLQHAAGLDSSGEAEATDVERSVLAGRAPRLGHLPRRVVAPAAPRRLQPARKPLTPLGGTGPDKPTGLRLSTVGGPLGQTSSLEAQLFGWAAPRFPLGPFLNFQFIPELRVLAGGRVGETESAAQVTLSFRLIFVLTGGILQVAEAFGSSTFFVDTVFAYVNRNNGVDTPTDPARYLTGYLLLRTTMRYGVRALRSLLEWSQDSPTFTIARIDHRIAQVGDQWRTVPGYPKPEWGPELKAIGSAISARLEQARDYLPDRLLASGWRNITQLAQLGIQGARAGLEAGASVASAPGRLFLGALLNARDRLNPANWDTTRTPPAAALLGQTVWQRLGTLPVEQFILTARGRLSSLGVSRDLARTVALNLNEVEPPAGASSVQYHTADSVLALTPLDFVRILQELQALRFTRDLDSFALPSVDDLRRPASAPPAGRPPT